MYWGQVDLNSMCAYFADPDRVVSSNYGISKDGEVCLSVDEKNRAWTSNDVDNDGRAVTIEIASDRTPPYAFTDAAYQATIALCTDICRRNGKNKLLWIADKAKRLSYKPADDEMVLTKHNDFFKTDCPGAWMEARMGELAEKVTAALKEANAIFAEEQESYADSPEIVNPPTDPLAYDSPPASAGLQGVDLAKMGIDKALNILGPIFTREQEEHGLLASVMLAQLVTESGCNSELFRNANAGFGMKCLISGNNWPGSVWDGKSKYKLTWTEWHDGKRYESTDFYRAYPDIEHSIEDHRAYLLNAKKEDGTLRYAGLSGCTDAEKAVKIIVQGGYCTEPDYADALLYYLETYALGRWEVHPDEQPEKQEEQAGINEQTGGTLSEYKGIPLDEWNGIKKMVEALYQTIVKNDNAGSDG